MSERDVIAKGLKLKQKSIFDMDELYKLMFKWFSTHNYDFQEKEYIEKVQGDGSKSLEIGWMSYRKISDYIKFRIDIKFLILGLTTVEIEVDRMKRKTNSGDIEMRFDAYIETDYEGKWESQPITKFFREFYNKYIIKGRMEGYEVQLHEELYELMGEIKAFLNLYKFQGVEA